MGRAPCCDKTKVKRGPWSPEEDTILGNYIQRNGTGGNWIALPRKAGLNRCGKSCRLRWSVIASKLPAGRTDNDVKNHWNTKLKKKLFNNLSPPNRNIITAFNTTYNTDMSASTTTSSTTTNTSYIGCSSSSISAAVSQISGNSVSGSWSSSTSSSTGITTGNTRSSDEILSNYPYNNGIITNSAATSTWEEADEQKKAAVVMNEVVASDDDFWMELFLLSSDQDQFYNISYTDDDVNIVSGYDLQQKMSEAVSILHG